MDICEVFIFIVRGWSSANTISRGVILRSRIDRTFIDKTNSKQLTFKAKR